MTKKKAANERKRAPNGQGTPSLRPDGRYRLDITLGRDPGTGKLIRKTLYAWSEDEVLAKARKLQVQHDEGTYVEPSKLAVGQWLDVWHKEYLGGVKPDTAHRYEKNIRLYLKPHLGAVKLATLAVSPHMIQAMYNKLQHGTGKQKALSPKSIHGLGGTLHSAMEKALMLGYIPRNPVKGCELPRVEKREMAVIKDDDVPRFFEAIKGHQLESVYLMDVFTGMRQGEILGLTWDCVDLDSGMITVRQQIKKECKKGGKYYFAPLKTDKTRTLTASLYVQNLLRKQRAKQKEWQLRAGSAWDNTMNLVFTNELGRYLIGTVVYKNLKAIVKGLGLDAVRFHDLRHTFALISLQNGDDIKTLQENMGHSNISTTLDTYGHVSERMKKDSAARMDAYIETLLR